MKLEIFRIPRILHSKLTIFHFQAKVEKQALELGDRMSNKPVDIIAEVYQKIRVPSDNIYKSKLVGIEIYKVSLLPSCVSHTLTQVEKESAEPTLVHSNKVKVKHGLIVIADDEGPKGLKVSYRRQGLRKSLSLSNRLLRFEEI